MWLTARNLFDGHRWCGPGWLRVDGRRVVESGTGAPPRHAAPVAHYERLAPALVDAHCHVTGYLEYPGSDVPFAPHQAYLALLREAGVGAVRDLGNHAETAANLALLADPPLVQASGPVIDEPPGKVDHCRLVVDEDTARAAVRGAAATGATWVKTYSGLGPQLLAAVVSEARELGLRVAHRPGRTDALTAAELGVSSLEHLPLCLPSAGTVATPAEAVTAWGRARGSDIDRLVGTLAATPVAVTPILLAWRRGSLLEEAVAEPRLARLVPVAPYHRYLAQMQGPGLAFGRRYAKRYLGYEHLRGRARGEYDAGWRALQDTLLRLREAGVRLLVGSDAPSTSVVPGFGLHEEMAVWESAGVGADEVLSAATAGNAEALGLDVWSAGVVSLATRATPAAGGSPPVTGGTTPATGRPAPAPLAALLSTVEVVVPPADTVGVVAAV